MSRLFGKKSDAPTSDKHWSGRIDIEKIKNFLSNNEISKSDAHFFICGPGSMIKAGEQYLKTIGIGDDNIHVEYFFNESEGRPVEEFAGTVILTARLDGQEYVTEVKKGKTLLDALMDIGADPPYSCTSGVCSTCMAKVHNGKVEMETCLALDDDEIADGYILTCQSHPKTSTVEIEYE